MPRSNKKRFPLKPPQKSPTCAISSCTSPGIDESSLMVRRAIGSASKHGIQLIHGTPNQASGNCSLESVVHNVNERDCFEEKLPLSIDYYGWNDMMESGVYERGLFGDLMLFGICCGVRKLLLIFNSSS
jgi:hypothetical protein